MEILVVDNASTDRTVETAQRFDVEVVQETVRGVAKARNPEQRLRVVTLLFSSMLM